MIFNHELNGKHTLGLKLLYDRWHSVYWLEIIFIILSCGFIFNFMQTIDACCCHHSLLVLVSDSSNCSSLGVVSWYSFARFTLFLGGVHEPPCLLECCFRSACTVLLLTCINSLFFWVFSGTKPFDNTDISSGRMLESSPMLMSDCAPFSWAAENLLNTKYSTFSFPAILEMRKMIAGSCYCHLQHITVLLGQPCEVKCFPWYKPARPCLLTRFYRWLHSAIFNNPSGYTLGIIDNEYCFAYSW